MSERWGVVADDVTGACDVAAELSELGLDVAIMLGVPHPDDVPRDADVVVVGLRTRTAPRATAVAESVAALRALRAAGLGRYYQKYCSTFDSTDEGMIGPVAEALLAETGARASVGTPATPHSDRTVYRGHLFVGDRMLSESPLASHPLTPMTDPDLVRVLGRQSTLPVRLVDLRAVRGGAEAVRGALAAATGHVLVDSLTDDDLDSVAAALDAGVLPGGGAGLITAIGRLTAADRPARAPVDDAAAITGGALVIVGSASSRTRQQVDHVGGPTVVIDAAQAAHDPAGAVATAIEGVQGDLGHGRLPVVSAAHDPGAIAAAQRALGVAAAAEAVEDALAGVAVKAVRRLGVRRLLVAGGETSGAVARALGIRSARLTARVDPGVAWAVGAATAVPGAPELAILLKSGNFGGVDLVARAWEAAP